MMLELLELQCYLEYAQKKEYYMKKKLFKSNILLITYAVILIVTIVKIDIVLLSFSKVFEILSPIFIGIAIAFVLNHPFEFFKKTFAKIAKIQVITISLVTVYLLLIGIMTAIIAFLIPQLLASLNIFYNSLDKYSGQINSLTKNMIEFLNINEFVANNINSFFEKLPQLSSNILSGFFPKLIDITSNAVTSIFNIVLGIILSVYILSDKDRIKRQILAILYALLPNKAINKVKYLLNISNKTFNLFVIGQLTEAFILGVLCFIGLLIFKFNYPLLISVIVAVTSLIPVAGVIIGAIPSIFILFMAEPIQALWFILFIAILQLVEGNLIYPRVVGDSLGLPPLWVLLAIIIGGGLIGILGILLSVPIISILYQLIKEYVSKKTEEFSNEKTDI
jgi:predicted PurR-regulated permease PerM